MALQPCWYRTDWIMTPFSLHKVFLIFPSGVDVLVSKHVQLWDTEAVSFPMMMMMMMILDIPTVFIFAYNCLNR